ncbi:hypothetical protein [uncultured Bartonella sp.]|nr:hypothetical protein [uncultured Bartonella sp.]
MNVESFATIAKYRQPDAKVSPFVAARFALVYNKYSRNEVERRD